MPGFDGILGQPVALGSIESELARGRLNHAYLFEGRQGTGRLSLARALARMLLCQTTTGCGQCKGCKMFGGGSHPDYLEIPREANLLKRGDFVEGDGDRPDHTPILNFIYLKPVEGGRRVVVIPDSERMNEAAANAFLKTLEEPPEGVHILMTTSARDRLLGTIVSRCRRLGVQPLDEKTIAAELLRRGAVESQDDASALALLAEGSLGQALAFSQGQAPEDWQWMRESLGKLTPDGALQLAKGMLQRASEKGSSAAEKRQGAKIMLDLAALALRQALRRGGHPLNIERALQALWDAGEQLDANVRTELVLQAAALNLVSSLRRPDVRTE